MLTRGSAGPIGLGVLFEKHAEAGRTTTFRLDRAFDIAPDAGLHHDVASLAGLVSDAAAWLYCAGARPGDRVAIVKENHWDYVLLACAAARLGAIPAMVSDRLPVETMHTLLARLSPSVLVTTSRSIAASRSAGRDITDLATNTLCLDCSVEGALSVSDVANGQAPPAISRANGDPMIITHTSGTTGAPKLVVHSADTIMGHLGRTESIRWPIVAMKRTDTVATAIAFAHMRIITWTTGTLRLEPSNAVLISGSGAPAAERVLRAHPPTYVEALPSTYLRWESLTTPEDNVFSRVRLFVSTFDAVHPPTVRKFLNASATRMPTWLQGWGQSETGPMTFRLLTRLAVAKRGERHPTTRNVGRPIPGFTGMRVVDPDTLQPVAAGQPGVVLARTNGRCLGYVGEEDRWERKAHHGWWNTGDYGVRTRAGAFLLLDREVDVIPGMSCVEIEDVLADRLPDLIEAVIVGVPGQHPLPVLCTRSGTVDEMAWRQATRDMPELADPVVLPWDDVPRTGTGKVRRPELRDSLLGKDETYGTGLWT